jgi:hypothetical protein
MGMLIVWLVIGYKKLPFMSNGMSCFLYGEIIKFKDCRRLVVFNFIIKKKSLNTVYFFA